MLCDRSILLTLRLASYANFPYTVFRKVATGLSRVVNSTQGFSAVIVQENNGSAEIE